MYRPPAVRYEVASPRSHAAIAISLCALGAVATVYFLVQTTSWLMQLTALCALAFAVVCAIWGRSSAPQGTLRWDGTHWHWSPWGDVPVAQLQVLMDLQFAVVLRLRGEGGLHSRFWLERRWPDPAWRSVRRALVAHQRHPAPQASVTAAMDERALP